MGSEGEQRWLWAEVQKRKEKVAAENGMGQREMEEAREGVESSEAREMKKGEGQFSSEQRWLLSSQLSLVPTHGGEVAGKYDPPCKNHMNNGMAYRASVCR
uniref:Uncharacterized protein n=1 Tax=Vespula pensylvanica TaxID=30213 RepID=A0A834KHT4_VESPE|nr:hypothetical protein H0235_014448 [Vespula pensylvanica]